MKIPKTLKNKKANTSLNPNDISGRSRFIVSLLVLAVLIFSLTLFIINRVVYSNVVKQDREHSKYVISSASSNFETLAIASVDITRGFLSSWFFFFDSTWCEPTPHSYVPLSSSTIYDEDLDDFKNDVLECLGNFLRLYSCYDDYSASFVVVPGVYPETGDKYFVPFVTSDGKTSVEVGKDIDLANFRNLINFIGIENPMWYHPDDDSHFFESGTICLFIPLRRENGDVFGIFDLNIGQKSLIDTFEPCLPYGEEYSAFLLLDENDRVIATVGNQDLAGKAVNAGLRSGKSAEEYGINIYSTSMPSSNWTLYTVCDVDTIYGNASRIVVRVFVITSVGFILMLLCILFIYRRVLRDEKAKSDAESALRLASDMQNSFLKPQSADGCGFSLKAWIKPAFETGGDLYDYVIKSNCVIFIIGDVSGKGISAALFMTQVCSLFRSGALTNDDPRAIVSGINDILCEDNPSMVFCTMIVGRLDLGTGNLQLCNAGHTKPILIQGGKASFLKLSSCLPVALMKDSVYVIDTFELHPSDQLFLYTDGLSEARSENDQFFGEQRIIDCFEGGVMDGFEPVLAEIHSFTGKEPQSDDLTMFSLYRK